MVTACQTFVARCAVLSRVDLVWRNIARLISLASIHSLVHGIPSLCTLTHVAESQHNFLANWFYRLKADLVFSLTGLHNQDADGTMLRFQVTVTGSHAGLGTQVQAQARSACTHEGIRTPTGRGNAARNQGRQCHSQSTRLGLDPARTSSPSSFPSSIVFYSHQTEWNLKTLALLTS